MLKHSLILRFIIDPPPQSWKQPGGLRPVVSTLCVRAKKIIIWVWNITIWARVPPASKTGVTVWLGRYSAQFDKEIYCKHKLLQMITVEDMIYASFIEAISIISLGMTHKQGKTQAYIHIFQFPHTCSYACRPTCILTQRAHKAGAVTISHSENFSFLDHISLHTSHWEESPK